MTQEMQSRINAARGRAIALRAGVVRPVILPDGRRGVSLRGDIYEAALKGASDLLERQLRSNAERAATTNGVETD